MHQKVQCIKRSAKQKPHVFVISVKDLFCHYYSVKHYFVMLLGYKSKVIKCLEKVEMLHANSFSIQPITALWQNFLQLGASGGAEPQTLIDYSQTKMLRMYCIFCNIPRPSTINNSICISVNYRLIHLLIQLLSCSV